MLLGILFSETQRFIGSWDVWAVMIVVVLILARRIYLRSKYPKENVNPVFRIIFGALMVIIVGGSFFVLFAAKLETKIDETGIYYTYFPFIIYEREIPWSDVVHAYTRTYQPTSEYGGWGLKGSSENRAYNVSGDQGLQLELKNGKKILIGTQRPKEIQAVISRLSGIQKQ